MVSPEISLVAEMGVQPATEGHTGRPQSISPWRALRLLVS